MIAIKFKELMQIYGITYADIGIIVGKSPATVKQRLDTESTFSRHLKEYKAALEICIENKEKEKAKALEGFNEIS